MKKSIFILLAVIFLFSLTEKTFSEQKIEKTSVGVEVLGIPILAGVKQKKTGEVEGKERVPQVVIYKYNYQVEPTAERYVSGEPRAPSPASYQTHYSSNPFGDPTLRIWKNESKKKTIYLNIDGGEWIKLAPKQATTNIHLDIGDHVARIKSQILTAYGWRDLPEKIQNITIRATDNSRVYRLH